MVAAITDDYDILCLLIWQAIFHLSGRTVLKTIQRREDPKKGKRIKRGKCEHFNQGKGNADVVSTRDAQEYSVPGATVEESVKD